MVARSLVSGRSLPSRPPVFHRASRGRLNPAAGPPVFGRLAAVNFPSPAENDCDACPTGYWRAELLVRRPNPGLHFPNRRSPILHLPRLIGEPTRPFDRADKVRIARESPLVRTRCRTPV